MSLRILPLTKPDKFSPAALLFCFLIGLPLFAQQQAPPGGLQAHRRYLFIDLGTLGDPVSYPSASGGGNVTLNNQGEVGAYADINVTDPDAPNCFNLDCYLSHTFRRKHGHLTELDTIGDNTNAAAGINSDGWIAGFSLLGETDPASGLPIGHAVLWKHQHAIDLGTLTGTENLSNYVNDVGQVVGIGTTDVPDPFSFPIGTGFQNHAFIWEKGAMRDIGTLGGPDAAPVGICENSRKDFVTGGSYTSFDPNPETGFLDLAPFLWDRGAVINLGSLGGTFGYGQCANNRGQVIGQSNLAGDSEQHTFLWESGQMKDLGTLGGTFSLANWLTRSGIVVGGATTANDEFFHAAMWNRGRIIDLGVLPGYDCSNANALNSKDQIVGQAFDCATQLQHATLWEDGGLAIDLNALIPPDSSLELVGAININEQGEILGVGVPPGSPPTGDSADLIGRLFLLIPCDRERGDRAESCESTEQNSGMARFAAPGATNSEFHGGLTHEAFSNLRARFARSRVRGPALRVRSLHP